MWLFVAVFIVLLILVMYYQNNKEKKLDKMVSQINADLEEGNLESIAGVASDDISELELIQKYNMSGRIQKSDIK